MHIRKDDLVEVIAGDDVARLHRKPVKVLQVFPREGKILVEGVNRTMKHVKPNKRNPQGGKLSKELPIDASNVQLFCPSCRRGVRAGKRYLDNGAKERYCKKCSTGLGTLAKPKAQYKKV